MKAVVRKLSLAMTCIGLGATSVDAQVLLHRGTSREIEQGRLVRHVVDTPLADLPRLWQVLDQFPLVEASANSLRIQGVGEPSLYFAERRIDRGDLEHISPKEIERIELVMNDEFSANTPARAAIRIVPKKQTDNNLGGYVGMDLLKQQEMGYNTLGELYWHGDKLSLKISGSTYGRTNNFEQDNEIAIDNLINEAKAQGEDREIGYDAYTDLVYQPRVGQEFGLSYRYHREATSSQTRAIEATVKQSDILRRSYQAEKVNALIRPHTNHKINGYYHALIGAQWTLHAEGSYIYNQANSQLSTIVKDLKPAPATRSIEAQYSTLGQVLAWRIYAERSDQWGSIQLGWDGNLSQINQQAKTLTPEALRLLPNSQQLKLERSNSVYAHWSNSFAEHYAAHLGIRLEQTQQRTKDMQTDREIAVRRTWYLLPSAGITYSHSDGALSLQYSSAVTRPSYRWLQNSALYVHEYALEAGNPLLRPRVDHTLTLGASYHDLSLELSGQVAEDLQMEDIERHAYYNSSLMLIHKNIDAQIYRAQLAYTPNWEVWQPSWTLSSVWYIAKGYQHRPTIEASWDNLINLPWGIVCTVGLSGAIGGSQLSKKLYNVWQIDTSVSKSIGSHWSITLRADDMLTTGQEEYRLATRAGQLYHLVNSDYPDLSLSVSYRFNNTKTKKYRGGAAGTTESERL